jgi:hypothetical protein
MLPLWVHIHQASVTSHLMDLLLQAHVLFWLQIAVVVIGTGWCLALAGTLLFGGWYAYTHPTTGNDWVMQRLVRLLWFLTFGLTDDPSPDLESEDTSRGGEKERSADPPIIC